MDIGRAFGIPFKDVKWFGKAAWAGLWMTLPFTGFALYGYTLDYIRNVANGYETPLPEWTGNFGRYWVRGLLVSIALGIYMLPATILMVIGYLPMLGAIVQAGSDPSSDATSAMAALGGTTICVTSVVAIIYIVAVSILSYAALTHYALSESFGAFFQFKEIIARLRTNSGYFTAWLMTNVIAIGVGFVAGILASILTAILIGSVLVPFVIGVCYFVGAAMAGHLFGQYAAKAYGLPGLQPVAAVAYAAPGAPPAPYTPPVAPYAPPAAPVAPAPAPPAPPAPPAVPAPPAAPAPPTPPAEAAPPAAPEPPTPPAEAAPPAAPEPPAPPADNDAAQP
jgi:hypothetical protein